MSVVASEEDSDLMTPNEVAAAFRVHPKTVARWANAGLLTTVRTFGGHRRFRRDEVVARLAELGLSTT